jgi:hypothetical protein
VPEAFSLLHPEIYNEFNLCDAAERHIQARFVDTRSTQYPGSSAQVPGSLANPREVARPGAGSQPTNGSSSGSSQAGSSQYKGSQSDRQAGSGGSQPSGRDAGSRRAADCLLLARAR